MLRWFIKGRPGDCFELDQVSFRVLTAGSGPLIQVFFPRKMFTDKWSALKFLWDVLSDCVSYKIWSILHLDFEDNELKYRMCKIHGNLTNFIAIFYCITPLCEMPSLSSVYRGTRIPVIQGSLAQRFNGNDIKIWKCHKSPHCELRPEGWYVPFANFYKEPEGTEVA